MLGRGDVGKVYLVREKKTGKLYAMKGRFKSLPHVKCDFKPFGSAVKKGNDRAQENQTRLDGARDSSVVKSSFHRDSLPFFPI